MKNLTMLLACAFLLGISSPMFAQSSEPSIDAQLTLLLENNEITAQDANWVITDQHTSSTSDVQHIYYRQTLNGIEIYGSESSVHLLPNGEVLQAHNKFIENAVSRSSGGASPSLTAAQAVQRAASHFNYSISADLTVINSERGTNKVLLSDGGISLSPIPAKLVYQMNEAGQLVLAWDLSIEEVAQENWWSVRVDATTGAIVDQNNFMTSCNFDHDHSVHEGEEVLDYNKNLYDIPNYKEAMAKKAELEAEGFMVETYEVFAMPLESPYYGNRTIEVIPANFSSPFGWHDTNGATGAEFTVTRGNNANAYDDGDNQGYQPDAGSSLEFTGYPFDQNYTSGNPFEDAAITNLFYWTNIIHDVLYVYGFDEASGNFQENNYGNGGAGSDSVNSEAQDGSGTCNANFGTPGDGNNPRMQMYVCGNKDGDFDNLVIIHEYGHGISNRLTGGGNNTGCLSNQEQMGEGWSDWYGVIMTYEPGDTGTDSRGVGTYLFNQGPGGNGIRPFPYNTDIAVNPQTYDDIKTASVPHGVGSVWCTTLWEVTWALVDEHGFDNDIYNFTGDVNQDAGNVQAMALVTEAMKLQPCSPGFVDGRDAIFAADLALYGGANECLLWDAFAKRGLGVSADQGSSGSRGDGTEAFDTPSGTAQFTAPGDVCVNEVEITGLGGGTPFGGEYSGPGVTDDGNGSTYSFDPQAAGIGVHTITYTVPTGACSTASSDTDDIEVFGVPAPPTATGVSDFCVGDDITVTAVPNDPNNTIRWYDDATGGQPLAVGTSYTFAPTGSTSVWAEETPAAAEAQLKISEITLQADALEIQNIGVAADYSGYSVALSDEPYSNINSVNSVVQTLGAMGANSTMYWTDPGGGNDWGVNIFWNDNQPGWILIIDDNGDVVDSVFWNTPASEIATFNVTINGFNVTAADLDWTGNGANFGSTCNESYRRDNESNSAVDWAGGCQPSDYGVPNADINLGYQGCFGDRAEAEVTADMAPPTIDCPANITLDTEPGECTVPSSAIGTPTTTDNCGGEVATNDAPADLPVGVTVVTWTVTDTAGNTATCTQEVTVEDGEDPELTCPANVTVDVNEGEQFTIPDYTGDAVATDNCTASPALTQDPAAGTQVGAGTTTITITAEDDAGNTESCIFLLTVNEIVLGLEDNELSSLLLLYPNPTSGDLTLLNTSSETLVGLTITDVNGRIIETISLSDAGTETNFSIANLAQGMYFIRIDAEQSSSIKRIIKQ
ncbi:MAG: M36 family metallopeptidase [Bacteroidota bacterium]